MRLLLQHLARRKQPAASLRRRLGGGLPSLPSIQHVRGLFEYLWGPKTPPTGLPPASPTQGKHHEDLFDKQTLWGAKTGIGSKHPFPPQATESLLDKLEKAHYCTTHLAHHYPHRLRHQHHAALEELVDEHWKFKLERRPSTLPNAGLGLFLTRGQVQAGDVLTLYPGLWYRIPYDLEACMPMDEVSFTPSPPTFLLKNDYLLRFHHPPTGQHLLLDGCPRGVSALNFITANQRRGHPWANMEWLESTAKACGRRPPSPAAQAAHAAVAGGGEKEAEVCLGEGGEPIKVPTVVDTIQYFTHKLGLGHNAHPPRGKQHHAHHLREKMWKEREPKKGFHLTDVFPPEVDEVNAQKEQEKQQQQQHQLNDCRDPDSYNAEFHLSELPKDLPPHLLKFVPNLHFSDNLGDRRFTVLVTAAKDLEVPPNGPPVEIFVPYASPFGGPGSVCKHGFPLL